MHDLGEASSRSEKQSLVDIVIYALHSVSLCKQMYSNHCILISCSYFSKWLATNRPRQKVNCANPTFRSAERKASKTGELLGVSQAETETTHFQQPKERKLRGCYVLSLAQAEITLRGISFALGFKAALPTETHAL